MKVTSFLAIVLLSVGVISLTGCGSDGNVVIQPTETFEPTAEQKRADEQEQKQRQEDERTER